MQADSQNWPKLEMMNFNNSFSLKKSTKKTKPLYSYQEVTKPMNLHLCTSNMEKSIFCDWYLNWAT
jgi:hypothetical protein